MFNRLSVRISKTEPWMAIDDNGQFYEYRNGKWYKVYPGRENEYPVLVKSLPSSAIHASPPEYVEWNGIE